MNLIGTVLQVVAPVFLMAGLGFGWVRLGYDYPIAFVTKLAMTLAVPALVFTALMRAQIAPDAMAEIMFATLTAYAIIIASVFTIGRLIGLDRRTYWGPLIFGNTGNVGLPLALFAFGDTGLTYGVVMFAFTSIGQFTLGIWLVSNGKGSSQVWKEPMVIATIAGAVFWSMGWETPVWLTNGLLLLGQMAIPLMLLTLGVAVGRLTPKGLGRAAVLALGKTLGCGLIALGVGLAFGLSHVAMSVLILQLMAPVAVISYFLAERFDADAQAVAGLVFVSTLLSVITFPLALGVLLH